jgi:8-oxo-dGTP pyrophosphatase MutT (NUDIX family)
MSARILLMKAHVKGHYRDGKWVSPYETKAPAAKNNQPSLFGGSHTKSAPKNPPEGYHPKPGDKGEDVAIKKLSTPTRSEAWMDPSKAVTVTPGHPVPASLGGVAFQPWSDHPRSEVEWEEVAGQNHDLDEPEFHVTKGKHPAAGVVIEESDGRIWLTSPTNQFGGYKASFPKGTIEDGMSLQSSAIKEAFEESGLQVEITGFLADVERSTSTTRFYRARRVGGNPADMGWESQAMNLAPVEQLDDFLNSKHDKPLIGAITGDD